MTMATTTVELNTDTLRPVDAPYLPQALQSAAPIEVQWCVGIVGRDALTGQWQVSSGGWQAKAQVASSCLLQPMEGDSVACLKVAPDQAWITAILSREEGSTNLLRCKGQTQWQVDDGNFSIEAHGLKMNAESLHINAQTAQIALEDAHVAGKQFKFTAGLIKVIGSTLSTVMERIQQYSQHYTRNTDGTDQVSANHVQMQAKQLMQLDAQHTLVSGERLVKARGAQIHFG
jgi:hypothetical protein